MEEPGSIAAVRTALLEQFKVVPIAWSHGGGDFGFVDFLESAPAVGSYVRIDTAAHGVLLGQVHKCGVTQTVLAHVQSAPMNAITASVPVPVRHVEGAGVVLGRIDDGHIEPLDPAPGFHGAPLTAAGAREIAAHRARETAGTAVLDLGVLALETTVPAQIRAKGFNRHTLLCGQSGSGKTFSTGILLEQLLIGTDLRIAVLDPNSDFVKVREPRSIDDMNRSRAEPLTPAEYDALCRRYAERVEKVYVASASGGDAQLKILFSNLSLDEQAACLQLHPTRDLAEFNSLLHVVGRLGGAYTVDDVRTAALKEPNDRGARLAQRIENLGVAEWGLWARAGETPVGDALPADARAIIFDIGSLDSTAERHAAALVAFGRVQNRETREPLLMIIDEAHNICPPSTDELLVDAITQKVVWTAGEGRKYGAFMMLATQRPQKLHPNVVSQCENLVLMRVNSHGDREHLANLFSSVPPEMIEASRDFHLGEALVAGPVAPAPIRVQMGGRLSLEGGADLPTSWANPRRQ